MKKTFPPWIVPALIVLGGVIVVSKAAASIGDAIGKPFDAFGGIFGDDNAAEDAATADRAEQGEPSQSHTWYIQAAGTIEHALFGTFEDEDAVYAVMAELKNERDMTELITAFGTRRDQFNLYTKGLGAWLHDNLDGAEVERVNEILAGNGIAFRF